MTYGPIIWIFYDLLSLVQGPVTRQKFTSRIQKAYGIHLDFAR